MHFDLLNYDILIFSYFYVFFMTFYQYMYYKPICIQLYIWFKWSMLISICTDMFYFIIFVFCDLWFYTIYTCVCYVFIVRMCSSVGSHIFHMLTFFYMWHMKFYICKLAHVNIQYVLREFACMFLPVIRYICDTHYLSYWKHTNTHVV